MRAEIVSAALFLFTYGAVALLKGMVLNGSSVLWRYRFAKASISPLPNPVRFASNRAADRKLRQHELAAAWSFGEAASIIVQAGGNLGLGGAHIALSWTDGVQMLAFVE